jgi:hypothetical protein
MTVADFVDGVFARSRHAAYPVTDHGRPVRLLSITDVSRLIELRKRAPRHGVA